MKHVILLLLLSLSSLLGAQGINWPPAVLAFTEDTTAVLVPVGWDSLGRVILEWQSPCTTTTGTVSHDFRMEYSGGGIVSDRSITWKSGPIGMWQADTSEIVYSFYSATYYTVVISDFLKVEEVKDSSGVSYHFQCNEDVSDIIHEPCYALRNVPFLLFCDYTASNTLRLRFDPTIRLDWARELATGAAMTHFYPVWVSRK